MGPRFQRRLSQRVEHYSGLWLNRSSTTSKTQATEGKKNSSPLAADAEDGASPLLLFNPRDVSICEKPEEPAERTGPATRLPLGGATVDSRACAQRFAEREWLDCNNVSPASWCY